MNKIVESIGDYIQEIMYGDKKENRTDDRDKLYIFRGEANKYPLTLPSLYRNEPLLYDPSYYYRMLLSEIGKSNYSNNTELSSSMAELQHYGAKSNLLDVTTNALVALHFALGKDRHKKNNGVVKIYSVKKEDIKFDTGHTIALKLATNFMSIEEIWEFYHACETVRQHYVDIDVNTTNEILINKRASSSCEKSIDKILEFTEKITQIAKTRERYCQPFKIYRDLRSTQFFYGSKNTERIRRQSGAFIAPPIIGIGDKKKVLQYLERSLKENSKFLDEVYQIIGSKKSKQQKGLDSMEVEVLDWPSTHLEMKSISKGRPVNIKEEKFIEKFISILTEIDKLDPEIREKVENIYYKAYLGNMLDEIDKDVKETLNCREIIIKGSKTEKIRRELKKLGIDSGTIYPDIENISDSIIPSSRKNARENLQAIWENINL